MKERLRNGKWKFMLAALALGIFAVGCQGAQTKDRELEITTYPAEFSIRAGGTGVITAVLKNEGAVTTGGVTWATNNPAAVTVDSHGRVTGHNPGFAVITATAREGREQARTFVHVIADTEDFIPVTHVRLSTTATGLNKGMSRIMEARIYPYNATEQSVSWRSSNVNVATVDANGRVTGISTGTADITVITAEGGHEFTTRFTILAENAEELVGIEIVQPPNNVFVPIGFNPPLTGMIVEAVYSNNIRNPIPLGELEIEGFNRDIVEEWQTIKAKWRGFYDTWDVFVGRIPSSIKVVSYPSEKFYVIGDTLNLAGISIEAAFTGGNIVTFGAEHQALTVTVVPTMSVPGPKTVTFRYMGVAAGTTFEVFAFNSIAMRNFAEYIDNLPQEQGNNAANVVNVTLPSEITAACLAANYGAIGGVQVIDEIGSLYIALNKRHVNLDMSKANLAYIPGSEGAAFTHRNTHWIGNIHNVIFPPNITVIGSNAFRNNNIRNLNLSGLSNLELIGELSFASNGMTSFDLTGAVSLEVIGMQAFAGNAFSGLLDFSPATSLRSIGDRNFAGAAAANILYIEFPASLRTLDDYSMQNMINLRYVRFRGDTMRTFFGWSNFLYFMTTSGGSASRPDRPFVHFKHGFANMVNAWMHSYVLFHPNTLGFTTKVPQLGWYWHMDGRDTPVAHRVPLDYDPNTESRYSPYVDALRGQELLNFAEPFRGLQQITINVTNPAFAGLEVTPNTASVTGSTTFNSAGNLNITIGAPLASELRELNPTTAQEITGHRRPDSRFLREGYAISREHAGNPETWEVGGRSGLFGIPVIWPDDLATAEQGGGNGFPKFLMLELRLPGDTRLERWGRSQYSTGLSVIEEVKVVRYVYVDRETLIYRTEDGNSYVSAMKYVFLSLKPGWNLIEAVEEFSWTLTNDNNGVPASGTAGLTYLNVWISNGKMVDDTGGRNTISQANLLLKAKDVPWTKRSDDAFEGIMTNPITGAIPAVISFPDLSANYRAPWRLLQ